MLRKNNKPIVVYSMIVIAIILAIFKIYPTEYESLFTPLNRFVDILIWLSIGITLFSLCSDKVLPGEKELSNISYFNLVFTLGIGAAFFSYCVDSDYMLEYGQNPTQILLHWFGPSQWVLYIPFLLIEIYEAEGKLPRILSTIKTYLYAISMFLAIGISFVSACRTIPKLLMSMYGISISPYIVIIPIGILIAISVIRGIHKGMRIFSAIAMTAMYCVVGFLILYSIGGDILSTSGEMIKGSLMNFIDWNIYSGTEFDIKVHYPYYIWLFTWAGIMSPFIRKISSGRSLRSVVLTVVVGPSVVCGLYILISSYAFSTMEGGAMQFFGNYALLGIIYIIMIVFGFVTSSDSTCFTLDNIISSDQKINPYLRKSQWVIILCAFVTILMLCGNGSLDALYGISYITAPLLCMLMIACLIYMLFKKGNVLFR